MDQFFMMTGRHTMIVDNRDIGLVSRAHLVPRFDNPYEGIAYGKQPLKWVPRGTLLTIQGLRTQGGFYLQNTNRAQVSFAIDPSLPIGRADQARPLCLRPRQCVPYHQLHPDQRAAFLSWLAKRETNLKGSLGFCAALYTCTLEWRLFIDRVNPEDVVSDLLSLIDNLGNLDGIPLLTLLGWCAYFHGPSIFLAVIEEMEESHLRVLDGSLLHLALLDCAKAKRPLWPVLALTIGNAEGSVFDPRGWTSDLRTRFMERFRVLYPQGLSIYARPGRTQSEYRIHCPELSHGRCCIEVLDAVEGAPLRSALGAVARPIINVPRLDAAKVRQVTETTLRLEKFLESRAETEPDSKPAPELPQCQISKELDSKALEALREIIQRPQWPAAEFNALAKEQGIMPLALQDRLNAWCLDNFDELLLEGESPVAVNKQLSEKLRIYYDENN